MGNGVVKKAKARGSVWAGSERSGGERSEPERSGEPAQTAAPVGGGPMSDPEVLERLVRRRFTAAYKERIVQEADRCRERGEVGALLRREGLYSSSLNRWRTQLRQGGRAALGESRRGRKPKRTALEVENARLRQRNARLERRLRQAEAIIEIQKKVSEILEVPRSRIDESEGDA